MTWRPNKANWGGMAENELKRRECKILNENTRQNKTRRLLNGFKGKKIGLRNNNKHFLSHNAIDI